MKEITLFKIIMPFIFFVVSVLITLGIRKLIYRTIYLWSERTQSALDNLFVKSTKFPSLFWCLIISAYIGVGISELSIQHVELINKILNSLIIISVTIAIANFSALLIVNYINKKNLDVPITGLSQTLVKTIILIIGFTVLLGSLGISITPLITALGVGGLAVALALQDTLSNFFAGMHILIDKPIRIGDYIKLTGGEEGYVLDVGWRSTRIKMLSNNVVIVPNAKLAQSIITNYSLPESRMSLSTSISVDYSADLDRVERILEDEAMNASKEIHGMLEDPRPFIRFNPGFGKYSLDFTLICNVKEFVDQYYVQHELRKRIFRRFKKEGIEISLPIKKIYMLGEDDKNK